MDNLHLTREDILWKIEQEGRSRHSEALIPSDLSCIYKLLQWYIFTQRELRLMNADVDKSIADYWARRKAAAEKRKKNKK